MRYWLKHRLGGGEGLWLPVHITCPFCPLILCHTLTHLHSSDTLKTKRPTTGSSPRHPGGWELQHKVLHLDGAVSTNWTHRVLQDLDPNCWFTGDSTSRDLTLTWTHGPLLPLKITNAFAQSSVLVWESLTPRLWIPLYSEALMCELVLTNILATGEIGGQGRWPRIITLNVGGIFFFLEQSIKPIMNH